MGKKRVPGKETNSTTQEKVPTVGRDLSTTVQALQEVAQTLAATSAQMAQMMQQMVGHASGTGNVPGTTAVPPSEPASPAPNATGAEDVPSKGSTSKKDEEAKRFYERLEQTGQLMDVDANTDLAALPPRVTHIRRPDGSIERIGFSASPYTKK
jgi:hypothetical protein